MKLMAAVSENLPTLLPIPPIAYSLMIQTTDQVARYIYEKYGFKEKQVIPSYYGMKNDALILELILDAQRYSSDQSTQEEFETLIHYISEEEVPLSTSGRSERIDDLNSSIRIWLPDAPSSGSLLSPDQALQLISDGVQVTVEAATYYPRPYSNEDYILQGCTLCPSGSWKFSGNNTIILMQEYNGLDEMSYTIVQDFSIVYAMF